MVTIPNIFQENKQYELVPGDNDQWHIRIKEGDFIECVIEFGKISIKENSDMINFNFILHYTPDSSITVEDKELQRYAGRILESILFTTLEEKK